MLIRRASDLRSSEITDEQLYLRRREFMRLAGGAALAAAASPLVAGVRRRSRSRADGGAAAAQTALAGIKPKVVTTDEKLNSFEDITSYNNFYEFGTGKDDPAALRRTLKTTPVEGEDRRPVRQARRVPARGSDQAASSSRSASTGCAASRRGRW